MARTISRRGMLFALDLCVAFIIIILVCFLAFFVFVRITQIRLMRQKFFENEQNALFVDSLIKRSADENGLADISIDEKRILENRISDFENVLEKNRQNLLKNKVFAIKLNNRDIVLDKEKYYVCKEPAVLLRLLLVNGQFSTMEVAFCNDAKN
ncbi:MAG: hypothetical protein N3F05_02315 [Candidatus Diapherotrites archaeon]|nr:hypothetical protein [Candidatus Diapherotrites archaeon]